MINLRSIFKRAPKRTIAVISMIAAAIIIPTALFAWGPDRPTYTIAEPADHVTFNSIIDNPSQGDERNFVQVRDASADNTTYADSISLTAGHEYVVFVYFHNNASSSLNAGGTGIAHGAYVKAAIPAVVSDGNSATAVGYVGASNATPAEVWDNISFSNTTGGDIALRYITGSATIHSKGAVNGATMSDSIVSTGASIGYDSLNGVVPGCNEYAGYVTFRVKADQPNFDIEKEVRIKGTTSWSKSVDAKIGDTVEYLVTYKNTGTTTQNTVIVKDSLPETLTYIEGSTYVYNTSHSDGVQVSDNVVNDGINIGAYAANAGAYVKFSAKVTANINNLDCGDNNIENIVKVITQSGSKTDTADVIVVKECVVEECKPGIPVGDERCKETPPELPKTGAGEDLAAFLGLGTLVTSIGYYRASRRASLKR